MEEHPIDRFDPILRNLLTWRLVEEDGAGAWVLRPAVSERLGEIAGLSRHGQSADTVYVGRTCAGCRSNGLTRLRDGRYLCDACQRRADVAVVATPLPVAEERRARRSVFHRVRVRDLAS